jgi:NADH dehydrogenase FAD-containing subunit
MSKKLVLAGGGHAHMMLLANLGNIVAKGHEVTVVQPSDFHYYSGMGPGMLSTFYSPDDIRFNTRFVVERQGAEFIKAKATEIDTQNNTLQTDSGTSIHYDVLSCNVGSFVPFNKIEGSAQNIYSAKPIERLLEAQRSIIDCCNNNNSVSISVIGGGPAAVEIAGNAFHLAKTTGCKNIKVHLFAGKKMMSDFSTSIQKIIRRSFQRRGISIDESAYVEKIIDGKIVLENGQQHDADVIFLATGVKPSPIFAASAMATGPDGGLPVNSFLQSTEHANIFGGGDCIYYTPKPLAKVGVYAVRENPVLLGNILASLEGSPLKEFDPGGNYLLIFNLGEKWGALQKGPLVWGGKFSFSVKDYIDRKFMREFQALEV